MTGSDRPVRGTLSVAQAAVAARLLDELAGVYRGEDLGALAHELAVLLDDWSGGAAAGS